MFEPASTSFLGIVDVWTYVVGTLIVVLLPGPNSLYVLAVAARRGILRGYRAALGILLGDTVLMLAAILGMSALLKTHPLLFIAFKYLGGAYLAWLGVTMLGSAWRRFRSGEHAVPPVTVTADDADPLRRALLVSLLNPKAILFWMAFFIQFVDPAYPHKALSFTILGLIAQTMSITYLSALIFTGDRLASVFARRRRLASGLAGSAGALFIGFGVKLATATLA